MIFEAATTIAIEMYGGCTGTLTSAPRSPVLTTPGREQDGRLRSTRKGRYMHCTRLLRSRQHGPWSDCAHCYSVGREAYMKEKTDETAQDARAFAPSGRRRRSHRSRPTTPPTRR